MFGCKKIIILLLAVSFVLLPLGASSFAAAAKSQVIPPERTALLMIIDALVVRPFQISSLVIGTGAFVITSPWSAIGGNMDEAYAKMMVAPYRQTFKRPLGGF